MKNGYVITCPKCGAKIDEFSHSDEWFCDCGERGIMQDEDFDDDHDIEGFEDECMNDQE